MFRTANFVIIILALIVIARCRSRPDRSPILLADREAPLGWVYLSIYSDSTFKFESKGIIRDSRVYIGTVVILKDTIFFNYVDSIPAAGKTAVFNDRNVAYIDGQYSEHLNIKLTKLK